MTLLRLGDEAAGLDTLRRAWKRDPYDVRTYNLLNLFEKVIPARYTTIASAHLRFRIPHRHARRRSRRSSRRSWRNATASYVARYGFEPPAPVMFELYGDPHEFAVRTVGLPAIGVAGVCFGRVITSQAPTNHAFNWGMVLAHELAHVFAIQLSRSRVPRWFTEGLSELETVRGCGRSGRATTTPRCTARFRRGELPSLLSLSNAFVHRARRPRTRRAPTRTRRVAVDFLERRLRLRGDCARRWRRSAAASPRPRCCSG